jgi:hypothetical protein
MGHVALRVVESDRDAHGSATRRLGRARVSLQLVNATVTVMYMPTSSSWLFRACESH